MAQGKAKTWEFWYYTMCDILVMLLLMDFVGCNGVPRSLFELEAKDIHGNIVSLEKYKGKVSLVVNVASECGYTDNHYRGMVSLQKTFGHTDLFNVLAFPCNQFGLQEPGLDKEIYHFAQRTYGVNFPVFSKVNVRDENIHPVWDFLTRNSGQLPTWNFFKYLIDHKGQVITVWGPHTDPEELQQEINRAILNVGVDNNNTKNRDEF